MGEFKKTTAFGRGDNKHHHILWVDEETGEAAISPGSGASSRASLPHNIRFVPSRDEVRDESGNLIEAAVTGGFLIEPAEDGHTHEIEEYDLKNYFPEEKDESLIVGEALDQFKACLEIESESLERARESYDFRYGKQWDTFNKNKLEEQNRPALTINDIGQNVDELCGYQRQQRTDIHYLPIEDGDQKVADILNIVVRVLLDRCGYHREESKAFEDQVVAGRGWLNMYLSREKDIRGDLVVERFPENRVTAGEHEKEDLSDCEVIFKHGMYSLRRLKQLFPDKAEKIEKDYNWYLTSQQTHQNVVGDAYDQVGQAYAPITLSGNRLVDVLKKEYRLIERWLKIYIPSAVVVEDASGKIHNMFGWRSGDLKLIEKIGGFTVFEKTETKFRVTRFCSNVVLSDDYPADLPTDDFHIIPIYCQKHGNMFRGKIDDVKDPQRIVNFQYSQLIDIVNKMVNYIWFYDNNTFPDDAEKRKFLANNSTPGSAFRVMDVNRKPEKQEGLQFPSGVAEVVAGSSAKIKEIFNIQAYQGGANTSAEAILQRQKMRLTGNEYLFDNFSFAKKKLGKLILSFIQKYYTPDRIARIVLSAQKPEEVPQPGMEQQMPPPEPPVFTYDDIISLLQTADLENYDVAVSESGTSPIAKLETYITVRDMMQAGAQVPPELLVELADIPDSIKQKTKQMIQASQQAQSQAGATTQEGELNKTLIAQGITPPRVQAQLNADADELGLPRPNFNQVKGRKDFETDIGNNAQIT